MVYTSAPIGGAWRTDLVVVGTGRKRDDGGFEITVEETLFGVSPSPLLEFRRVPEGRFIFTFQVPQHGYGEPRFMNHRCGGTLPFTPADLAGARALSKARLETIVLSATTIFTGQVRDGARKGDLREVTVTEVLHGAAVRKGETVQVELKSLYSRSNDHWTGERESVYFVGGHDGVLFGHFGDRFPEQPLDEPPLKIRRILPGALAEQVRRVLPRRAALPIVEVHRGNEKRPVREVVFTGTVGEAMLILETDCYGAASLARRSLIRRRGESREPVLGAIRGQLLDVEVREPDGYRTLRRLIRTLGNIDRRDPQGDLEALIEEWLAFLQSEPPPAPGSPSSPPRAWRGKVWHPVNRAPLWCLLELGPERAREKYGERLVKLYETVPADWRPYIRHILDELQVFEAREMPRAISAAEAREALRGRPAPVPTHPGSNYVVAFSADGSLIFTLAGDRTICAWNPENLGFLGRVELPPGYEFAGVGGLALGRILAVEEGYDWHEWPGGRKAIVLEARSGERLFSVRLPPGASTRDARWLSPRRLLLFAHDASWVRNFDLETAEVSGGFDCPEEKVHSGEATADGATLFVPGYYHKGNRQATVRRISLKTGVQSVRPIPGVRRLSCRSFGLVPGGENLYFADSGMLVLDRETLETVSRRPLKKISFGDFAFSGDGRRYVVATEIEDHPEEVRKLCPKGAKSLIRIHDVKTGFAIFAFATKAYSPKVALDADGTRLVYVEDDGRLVLVNL